MKLKERILIISALLLAPVWAHADVDTGVNLNKTATYDYATQTGTIKLENFVGQVTKKINPNKSADVVLVVDGSRSMNGSSVYGMDALYNAVGSFVTQLSTASLASAAVEHRVSLIIFAGNSRLLCDFTSVESQTVSWFQGLIEAACGKDDTHIDNYGSGTMAHMALGLASYVMTGNKTIASNVSSGTTHTDWSQTWITSSTPAGARSDCNRYIVMMTDGALSGQPLKPDNTNYGSNIAGASRYEGNKNAEDQAVAVAKALKNHSTCATTVYSIGFLDEGETTNAMNNYMNNVSSNHLSPTNSDSPADYIPHDYYVRVDRTGGDLSSIFSNISEEIVAGCAAVDLASAEVKDIINGGNFKLPAGVDETNLSDAVKVYTVPCTNYEQTSSGPKYTFDETTHNTVTGITLDLDEDASHNPIITVSNFDYTANWCGLEYQSASKPKEPHGCKLVIEIPFTVNNYEAGMGEIETNMDGSGFTGTIKDGGGTLGQKYGSPVIDLYELTISRTGLRAGESAIYRVTDKDGKLIYTIALTGTGSGTVSQKLLYVPAGNVTVAETGWSWANRPSTASITKTISGTNSAPTYTFTLTSSGTDGKKYEDYKKNEFSK